MIKDDYEIQKIRDTAFCSGYNTAVSKYEKRNKELEKENAELKSELHRVSLNEQLAINNGRNFLKQIAELEAQIEKMKCCGNCENRYGQEKCADCHNYSKWKFKQAEQFYEEIVE